MSSFQETIDQRFPGAIDETVFVQRSLEALAELRIRSNRGEVAGAQLFDGVESTLRGYVAATRTLRSSQALETLGRGDEGLAAALARSALARFARLRTSLETSLAAIDAAIGFVQHDSEPEPVTEDSGPAGATAASGGDAP